MGETSKHQPYHTLGKHLRYLREQHSESLAEVSGAVEIDEKDLERIEDGAVRPAEEILLLLISHFNMQDQEAVQLWELAGYDGDSSGPARSEDILQDMAGGGKPVVVLFGLDARIMYTDSVEIETNQAGVVMNFGQQGGKKQQSIARMGMSYEQAEVVLHQLQMALLKSKYANHPKLLPPSTK